MLGVRLGNRMELEEEFVATTPSFPFAIPPDDADDKLAGVGHCPLPCAC